MQAAEIVEKKNLFGSWVAGGNPQNGRMKDDYYSTPIECTKALASAEWPHIQSRLIWEPACGEGAISKTLLDKGIDVVSTDLIGRGFGEGNRDFLKSTEPLAKAIITNPPFKLAENFIRHASSIGVDYMALLLKATFWHAAKRTKLFNHWMPARIYAMSWRPDFKDLGQPTMDCIWVVWDGNPLQTTYSILGKAA